MINFARFLAALSLCLLSMTARADYNMMNWGLDRTNNPYKIGINLGGTWYQFATITSGGVPSFNINNLSPIAAYSVLGNATGSSAVPQALTTLPAGLIYPYQSADTGAQPQTINSILSNIVIATNYMSAAQVTDVESYTGSLDLASTVNQIITNNAGKTIVFPAGKWRFASHLSCPAGTTIDGVGWGELTATTPSEPNVGTVLYQDYLAAADPKGIEATGAHCTIANLEIRQPQPVFGPGWVPNENPWAIYSNPAAYAELGGHRLTVRNVMLRNVTYGIFTDRARGGEFTDIYGQPMKIGIQMTGNGDTSTWRNLQFGWSFWTGDSDVTAYQNANAKHYVLGRVDTPMMSNIFSFGAKHGITFYYDTSHSDGNYDGVASGVKIANIDLDNCGDCLVLEDNPEVYITNFRSYPDAAVSPSRCIDSYGVVNPGANFGNLRLTINGGVCMNSGAPALAFAFAPGGTPSYPQYIKLDGFRITQPLTGSWSTGSPAISTPSAQATVQAWDITVDNVTDTSTILGGNGSLVWKRSDQNLQGNITAYTFTTLSTAPAWLSTNSAAGVDLKAWDIFNDASGVWHLAALNDTGSSGTDAIAITRSGYTPTLVAIGAPQLRVGTAGSVQGSLLLAGSTSGGTTLAAPTTGGGTMTLQGGTGTLATLADVGGAVGAVSIIPTYGATCNDATMAAASASEQTIVVTSGTTCTVSNDLTLSGLTPWIVEEGAAISVASTKYLTFSDGAQFTAGLYQVFTGAGTVRGLAFPKPEWWGLTTPAASIQAAHDSAKYAGLNRGVLTPRNTRYGVDLGCGYYTLEATVSLSPETWFPLDYLGCAPAQGGTRFIAAEGLTTGALIDLIAPSDPAKQSASFNIGQFQLVNNSTYDVTSLLRIGKDDGTSFNPAQQNRIHDIDFENFTNAIEWRNGRLIEFRNIGMFSNAPVSTCLYAEPTATSGSAVGDADFYNINCTPCRGTLASCSTAGALTKNISLKATNSGTGVAGLRFHSWVGYYSTKNIEISTTNGGGVSDIWVETGSQFDGHTETGVAVNGTIMDVSAVGTGSFVQDINIGNIYSRASVPTYSQYAYIFYADTAAAAGTGVSSINMDKTWIANITASGILATNVKGLNIDAIINASGDAAQSAVVINGNTTDATIRLNMQSCTAPFVYGYGVIVQDTADRIKVAPSVLSSCATNLGAISSSGTAIDLSGLYPMNTAYGPAVFDANGLATMLGFAIGSLPTCNAGNTGKVAYVTDANAPTYGATLSAGGAVKTLAFCDGSNWTAH
jgi:hypothetical protein